MGRVSLLYEDPTRAPIESSVLSDPIEFHRISIESNLYKFDPISIGLNYRIRSDIRWFDRIFHVILSNF